LPIQVIEWVLYHKDDTPPAVNDDARDQRLDDVSQWDQDFLKVDQGTLFELILAANYLDMKGLLNVTCTTVSNQVKGKTPEEIRKMFNIPNCFTKEEEDTIREGNKWDEDQ